MPPLPEPRNGEVIRPSAPPSLDAGSPANATALSMLPRVVAIASISSMKPMAPPSFRAILRSCLKNDRMRNAVPPIHIDWNAVADTNRKGTPACLAIACARNVLPVPGGPSNKMPRRGVPPSSSRNVAYPRNASIVRTTSSTCESSPLTSVSPTSTCSGYTVMCGERPFMSGSSAIRRIATKMPITGR